MIMGSPSDSSAQYIHMVHHLIEECMVFKMSKEECIEALFKYANIKPVITSTVWNELEKENREFFEDYMKRREDDQKASEITANSSCERRIDQKEIWDSSTKDDTEKNGS